MQDIRPKLVLLSDHAGGQVKAKLMMSDGTWKIEIFANEAHARSFAASHDMEVEDARSSGE